MDMQLAYSIIGAHPRVCGENTPAQVLSLHALGSSPRVRGKQRTRIPLLQTHRLIPACAGKTRLARQFNAGDGAHPRVCGENCNSSRQDARTEGSSPRVRGKLNQPVD